MKARVKATGEIVDVDFDKDTFAIDYPPYRTNEIPSRFFLAEQLEWIDIKEKAEPDYWEKLKHQYAGMAMQGMMAHTNIDYDEIVDLCVEFAHALVKKLKESK